MSLALEQDPAHLARLEAMVERQIRARGVKSPRVLEIMREAPRRCFVPPERQFEAYADQPLPIGQGQTISQPYIVALMTEQADLSPADRVLEIGTGCGYQTLILARLAASVHTVELRPDLQSFARRILGDIGVDNVEFRVGDGHEGWPEAAPFDAIVVTAAPRAVPPALKEQLADGGRLVIPVGDASGQELVRVTRRGERFKEKSILPVRFVPLTPRGEE